MTQLVPTFAGRIVQLTRITAEGKTFLARREEDHYVELPFEEFSQLLAEENWSAAAGQDGRQIPLSMVHHQRLLDPAHVFCIGLNYKGHIQETGKPTPQYPTVFAKFASSLTGPFSDIDLPLDSHEVDWEVELGIIIGKAARNVSIEQAPEHIAGYRSSMIFPCVTGNLARISGSKERTLKRALLWDLFWSLPMRSTELEIFKFHVPSTEKPCKMGEPQIYFLVLQSWSHIFRNSLPCSPAT
jgi:hypothetical protein